MDAGSSCECGKSGDICLDFLGSNHHEFCKLVDYDQDQRQVLYLAVILIFLVKALDVSYLALFEKLISSLHLCYCPVKSAGCLLGVSDDRHDEMRNSVINGELNDLRVYKDHTDFFRRRMNEDTCKDGVDTY